MFYIVTTIRTMSLPTEKLALVRLLLDIDDQEILNQAKSLLRQKSNQETDYLLSDEANAEHLRQGMKQAGEGKHKPVDVNNLWK